MKETGIKQGLKEWGSKFGTTNILEIRNCEY